MNARLSAWFIIKQHSQLVDAQRPALNTGAHAF